MRGRFAGRHESETRDVLLDLVFEDLEVGQSASLAKTVWGEIGQEMAALAFDVLGAGWADYRLTSRSLTIAGGTTQINKNITAQRVLGLPRQ